MVPGSTLSQGVTEVLRTSVTWLKPGNLTWPKAEAPVASPDGVAATRATRALRALGTLV